MTDWHDELTVVCGNMVLGGWTRVRVVAGVELCPRYFEVETTERYPGDYGLPASLTPGSLCQVFLGEDAVLTGYLDIYHPAYDANSHTVRLSGRSLVEDIVDCSIDMDALGGKSWEIRAATLGQAAKILCDPYNVQVSLPDGDPPLDPSIPFTAQPGQTVYALIEEIARSVNMWVWDDADGNLVLSNNTIRAATCSLVEGQNIERAEVELRMDQRYSRIDVIGQNPVYGVDDKITVNMATSAIDNQVPRKRVLQIIFDSPGPDIKWAQQLANWERNRRAGRSQLVRCRVSSWREQPGTQSQPGPLWQPASTVNVQLPSLKIQGSMVVSQVQWMKDEERGTTCELVLMPPWGLEVQPFIPPLVSQIAGAASSSGHGTP
ncbi:MAG TPA: hypothetical protein VFA12_13150 [Stellaceae bacterium]|nr:hypothetical protein [Stellaceae bacterium]